jgi:chemotaxis protein CheD
MYQKYDQKLEKMIYTIYPGEYHYTGEDVLIYTVLGSCISVCLYDSKSRMGGMNHFMLSGFSDLNQFSDSQLGFQNTRYGMAAMEMLINSLMKKGGNRKNFRAKVFGGSNMIKLSPGASSIADGNIQFAKWFLSSEEIPVDSIDVGGDRARKVYFNPFDGKAFVKHIMPTTSELSAELAYERQALSSKKAEKKEGDIEFF